MPNKTKPSVLRAMKKYHAKQMRENPEAYRRKKLKSVKKSQKKKRILDRHQCKCVRCFCELIRY